MMMRKKVSAASLLSDDCELVTWREWWLSEFSGGGLLGVLFLVTAATEQGTEAPDNDAYNTEDNEPHALVRRRTGDDFLGVRG